MSARLHVVVVSRWYPSPRSPAAGVFVRDQVEALASAADVTVLVPQAAPTTAVVRFLLGRRELSGEARIPVPGWRVLGAPARWLVFERALGRLRRRPDVVHLHLLLPDGLPLLFATRRRRIPLVVTEHANYIDSLLRSRRARMQLGRVLRGAAAVLTASTRLAAQLRDLERAAEPVTVGVPIDTNLFRPAEAPTRDFALAVSVLLGEPKGTDVLLRAWARAASHANLPRLVLVGEGIEPFAALARELGIEDRCTFAGPREHEAVAGLMQNAAFLVSASRDENFAGVVAETIASGTPAISTRVGEPGHYVTPEVGLLVEPGDEGALAEAIVDLAGRADAFDPDFLHEHIASRYGYAAARSRLLAVYETAMRTSRAS